MPSDLAWQIFTWEGDHNAYHSRPPSHGFMRWEEHANAKPFDTPEKWSAQFSKANDVRPTALETVAPPPRAIAFAETRAAPASWADANREALDAAPGANIAPLLREVAGE